MLYQKIQDMIKEWNPNEIHPLLDDEYNDEVKQIYNFINENQRKCGIGDLGQYIYVVFQKCCGNLFEKSQEECVQIANKIANKIIK
ncbi:hypothetical protein MHB77_07935 [Paenibacillus sp. FSL K6-3166]|uniref:hypothetical protein n=1 Tax=unclassified Paenibacillus TaxID=185978 RepID=UPI000B9FD7B4|nr:MULTISPECIES: hypothetical protein [unclassified Paenibacillus]OZQ77076.1 hypothetical protein CA598_30055 [Paenibacillus sp. VTT E-133291]